VGRLQLFFKRGSAKKPNIVLDIDWEKFFVFNFDYLVRKSIHFYRENVFDSRPYLKNVSLYELFSPSKSLCDFSHISYLYIFSKTTNAVGSVEFSFDRPRDSIWKIANYEIYLLLIFVAIWSWWSKIVENLGGKISVFPSFSPLVIRFLSTPKFFLSHLVELFKVHLTP
jgi:hypothetical protein